MLLIIRKLLPIFQILSKINFFGGPEASHLLFVHLPDIVVLDGKNDKSVWIFFEKGLWESLSQALSGRVLSLYYISAFLRMMVLNQLRAQHIHHSLSLSISRNGCSSLRKMLRLRQLKFDLLLALLDLVVVWKNISYFLLVISLHNISNCQVT